MNLKKKKKILINFRFSLTTSDSVAKPISAYRHGSLLKEHVVKKLDTDNKLERGHMGTLNEAYYIIMSMSLISTSLLNVYTFIQILKML